MNSPCALTGHTDFLTLIHEDSPISRTVHTDRIHNSNFGGSYGIQECRSCLVSEELSLRHFCLKFAKPWVPNLQDVIMPDDLRWTWCNNNGNKAHSKCNALEATRNHSPPHPLVHEKLSSMKLVPGSKKVGGHRSKSSSTRLSFVAVLLTDHTDRQYHTDSIIVETNKLHNIVSYILPPL